MFVSVKCKKKHLPKKYKNSVLICWAHLKDMHVKSTSNDVNVKLKNKQQIKKYLGGQN